MTINDNTTEPTTRRAGPRCLREGLEELVNSFNLEISLLQHAVEKSAEWGGSVLPGEIALQHTVFARDAILRVLEDSDSENSPCCSTGTEGQPVATDVIPAQRLRDFITNWDLIVDRNQDDAEKILEELHDLLEPTQPTMADIEWDDDVHAGLSAKHPEHGLVLMICLFGAPGIILARGTTGAPNWCESHHLTPIPGTKIDLTPRRTHAETVTAASIEDCKAGRVVDFDLGDEPQELPCPEDVPVGEVWEVEAVGYGKWAGTRSNPGNSNAPWTLIRVDSCDYYWAKDDQVTLVRRLVPEAAPDHPVTLSSVEDYDDAPVGTVVEYDGDVAVKRDDGRWYWSGQSGTSWAEDLADADPCTIVRWGK